MLIGIQDLLDTTVRFYLKEEYRKSIFSQLKEKHKDWRIVAKKLNIEARNLFSIRRGWEYRSGIKKYYFINGVTIKSIISRLKLDSEEVGKNIEIIKLGTSGNRAKISLPISVDLNKEKPYSIKRALAEYTLVKNIKNKIDLVNLPLIFEKRNNYILFKPYVKDICENLRLRGLKPVLKLDKESYKLFYRIPCKERRTLSIIPKEVLFNEYFAKEFGKWLGDRCGGKWKIGVGNKEWIFVKEFENLLKKLKQRPNISLTCRKNFRPPQQLTSKVRKVTYSKTQFGEFAYRVDLSNKILRNLVFDVFEENIFHILFHSKPSVRYAFYAGFFEAEGSIIQNSKNLTLSFGLNLKNKKSHERIGNLLKFVVNFNYLLSRDNFNPRISRKISKTDNSYTLKYDIILLKSAKTRDKEIRFIKQTFYPYLSHPEKIKKINQLEVQLRG